MSSNFLLFFILISSVTLTYSSTDGTQLIIENNCNDTIWPAILATAGHETLSDGGFSLATHQQVTIEAPKWWSGRIWARHGCCFDESGLGFCETGDCSGQLHCRGTGGEPPATLVEMTFGTDTNPMHYYDVSLVDGFNLPVAMIPVGAGAGCGVAACEADVNTWCPANLAVVKGGRVVGCKSACLANKGDEEDCCKGEFGSAETCKPTVYGKLFKEMCPRAYSYAFDEASGLKVCRADRYLITFCPPS